MESKEMEQFEELLKQREVQIIKNIEGVEDELHMLQDMDLNDDGDYAAANSDNLVETAIGDQQRQELLEIRGALDRMKDGSYGTCDMCEEEIGIERLLVKPHAKYCIDCREIAEKNHIVQS
jgi:DnaK suppressor protein